MMGKLAALPFATVEHKSTSPLEIIYFDIWDPAPTSSNSLKYFVIFVDEFTRYYWICF